MLVVWNESVFGRVIFTVEMKTEVVTPPMAIDVFVQDRTEKEGLVSVLSFAKVSPANIKNPFSEASFIDLRRCQIEFGASIIPVDIFPISTARIGGPFPTQVKRDVLSWGFTEVLNDYPNQFFEIGIFPSNPSFERNENVIDSNISAQVSLCGIVTFFNKVLGGTPQLFRVSNQKSSDDKEKRSKNNEQNIVIGINPLPQASNSLSCSENNGSAKKGALLLIGLLCGLIVLYLIVYAPFEKRDKNKTGERDD